MARYKVGTDLMIHVPGDSASTAEDHVTSPECNSTSKDTKDKARAGKCKVQTSSSGTTLDANGCCDRIIAGYIYKETCTVEWLQKIARKS